MDSKILKIKSKEFDNDFGIMYLKGNNSYVEFEQAVNILNIKFSIKLLTQIKKCFNLKIQLSNEIYPQNFFITKVKFDENKTDHILDLRDIIVKSSNLMQYSDINIQFVTFETNSKNNIEIQLDFNL